MQTISGSFKLNRSSGTGSGGLAALRNQAHSSTFLLVQALERAVLFGTTSFTAFSTSASDDTINLEDDVVSFLFFFRDRESRGFLDGNGFSNSLDISPLL